ncbi:alpha beta-hydrolase [Coniophora puteana RWD-64-598 SS2]|uniref:Alpha beta-hydrolase n=1 Tax=Coniophora puteana (strain RWD-64-598) TaxID=741705 RepID=A0A5M3MC77_CONPW|nr:alpha beta-hydrolase [Coniophora puteana RWD-64-598 SS2]EIW76808.1 alpha beta-hydrolase [Coniophora puteana RWD-64-598 SS2]
MSERPVLSLGDKLKLFPTAVAVLSTLVWKLLFAGLRGRGGASTYGREVSYSVTRTLTNWLSVRQLQVIRGTSEEAWTKWAAAHPELETSTEDIDYDAKLHWIGDPIPATKILVHVHGGGYVLPLGAGHLDLLNYLRNQVKKRTDIDMAVAVFEYTRAPQGIYPLQMQQFGAAMHHLLNDGIMPSNLIVSGDSAGTHIILSVISHFLHPHPELTEPPSLADELGGLLLISPRTSNETSSRSFSENSNRDMLSRDTLKRWMGTFRVGSAIADAEGVRKDGFYTEPVKAPKEWWNGLCPDVVKKVFISAGEHECFRDDILTFAESWKGIQGLDLTCFVEERGVHDSPVVDFEAGRPPTKLLNAIVDWLVGALQRPE